MKESENNFEALRRLLALKRHENPPPGYFNNFSSQVTARIRADEAGVSERLLDEAPWLMKFLKIFDAKPAFAGAFASALCLLLVLGIVLADRPDYSAPQPLLTQMTPMTESSAPLAAVSPAALSQSSDGAMFASSVSNNSISSLQPVASLFGQQNPFAQQVSFSVPSN
jgi:hypothetical protein